MKKLLALLLVGIMVFAVACGGSGDSGSTGGDSSESTSTGGDTSSSAAEPKAEVKVALIVTGGTLGDQAANDAIYNGIKKYTDEVGGELATFEAPELQDVESAAIDYCEEGYTLLAFNSSQSEDAVKAVAPDYPDVTFILSESAIEGMDNVYNINTDIADAAFLAGVYAALTNEEITGELKAGYVSGVRNPQLDRAFYAFQAGAKYIGGETQAVYVGSFTDAATAKEITNQMLSEGIMVVQAFAGSANVGVYEAIDQAGGDAQAMGAATGQFHMSDSIKASLTKDSDVTFYDVCKMIYEGELEQGVVFGLGDKAVGLKYNPDNADDAISQNILDMVEEIQAKIVADEIEPPYTEDDYNSFDMKYE